MAANGSSPVRALAPSVPATAWITTERLLGDTRILASALPAELDGIVGMARSGLLPATWLACHLHVPLAAVSESGHISVGGGWRSRKFHRQYAQVLLVDDTVCSGRTMKSILPILEAAYPSARILTAAIYSSNMTVPWLNYAVRYYPSTHYLEWNFFNSQPFMQCASDMDGIFCTDIRPEHDDDGPKYLRAIREAVPLYIARRVPVKCIITARLERYRLDTEAWLMRHGVRVESLIMGPWATLTARNRRNEVVRWKAYEFARSGLETFVESDPRQAPAIAKLAKKPVICPAAKTIYRP
jgi:hypoxanthine phosphoribosyltransferase